MNSSLFTAFFLSGFCSLLYQIIWLRLAFAHFGIITPVISVVLSVFMLGLSLGSWASGKWIRPFCSKLNISPILVYGLVEILIGVGALVVPHLFQHFSHAISESGEMDSGKYLFQSALGISASILPWCFLMGSTFPLGVAFFENESKSNQQSFSFLYLANVIGAMVGTALTALVFVETLGFQHTLLLAAVGNFSIGGLSLWMNQQRNRNPLSPQEKKTSQINPLTTTPRFALLILFLTGFCSMAMEVVWTRAFTPYTETSIYAFAFLLTTYLLATWMGSLKYRKHLLQSKVYDFHQILIYLVGSSFLPLVLTDPRLHPNPIHIFISIYPFCWILGYLTPQLIDQYSQGNEKSTANAYAINVIGCIFGPLVAGYLLLPLFGVKLSLLFLTLPILIAILYAYTLNRASFQTYLKPKLVVALGVIFVLACFSQSYEHRNPTSHDEVRRDYTATVISTGSELQKKLLVNGIGITILTPITKIMAHFPLSMMEKKPESALVICFGMGTTFRSLVSWGIDTTAVELVPSVKDAFGYYFQDAKEVMAKPNAHVIVDDGRRFLARSNQKFDLVTLDPPPPLEAAGSSLLYSRHFYDLVKPRLKDTGILQQWYPGGKDEKVPQAIAKALQDAFPYVKAYRSIEGWGYHFFASQFPIKKETAEVMISRVPNAAQIDLMEWYPGKKISEIYEDMLNREIPMNQFLENNSTPMITDDVPYNEYFLLRQLRSMFVKK